MATSKLFPFMGMGQADVSSLDSLIAQGIYLVNKPTSSINGWTAYGTIIVYKTPGANFVTQVFIHAQNLLAVRTSQNGTTWGAWKQISMS